MTKMKKRTDSLRLRIEDLYGRAAQAVDRRLPVDERAKSAVQSWLAVCGYIGIYILLGRYLWLCIQPEVWAEVCGIRLPFAVPDWVMLENFNDLFRILFLMLLSALILYIASPIGQRDYPPRAMFLPLPYRREQLPLRLLLYAGETLCLLLAQYLVVILIRGIGYIDSSWRDILEGFAAEKADVLKSFVSTLLRVFPKVFVCDLILREAQVIFYRKKVERLDAAENEPA